MVALTVIMAGVIGTFVLDLGSGVGEDIEQEAQAGVEIDVVDGSEEVQVAVIATGNAAYVNLTSSDWKSVDDDVTRLEAGETVTLRGGDEIESAGEIRAIAVRDDGQETYLESEEWDFS